MFTHIIAQLQAHNPSEEQNSVWGAKEFLMLCGWFISSWLAYRWGLRSQRIKNQWESESKRKAAIVGHCAYLKGWKHEFTRRIMVRCGYERNYSAFTDEIPAFVERSSVISHHISKASRGEFDRLVGIISESRLSGDKDRYDALIANYDALIEIISKEA